MSFQSKTLQFNTNTKINPSSSSYLQSCQTLNTSRSNKTLTSQQLQKKFDELYLENQKWKAKKQKLREQINTARSLQDMKQCTFMPSVNPEANYYGSSPSPFLKRQMDWLSKKEKKIEDMSRQSQKKLKNECSFHPKISKTTYYILHSPNNNKTSRILFSQNNELQSQGLYIKKVNNSYRQIHMKKQTLKQLQKMNSFHEFNLMTQRRFNRKQQNSQNVQNEQSYYNRQNFSFSDNKVPSNSPKVSEIRYGQVQDYIENIVIKSQQQDTFNSLSSLQLKTDRKDHNEVQMNKQPLKIFEQQQSDEQQSNNQILSDKDNNYQIIIDKLQNDQNEQDNNQQQQLVNNKQQIQVKDQQGKDQQGKNQQDDCV